MLIQNYLNNTDYPIKKVLFGGHWSNNPGWLLLKETDQDLTQPIQCPDSVLDCVYTEHVVEHLPFINSLKFFFESLRVLKPGGTFRIILPCLEAIMRTPLNNPNGEKYVYNSLMPHFAQEDYALKMLGLDGLETDSTLFLLNSMANKHDHTFLWSLKLLQEVLYKVGFKNVVVRQPGIGNNPEFCIERRRRGLYLGNDWKENESQIETWDCESGIIEAVK